MPILEGEQPQAPRPLLRLADLKRRFGWTLDSQATEAIDRFGCPNGRVRIEENVYTGQEVPRYMVWAPDQIDAWEEAVRRVFPALPLPKR
jgi:hypothetical protein